MSIRQQNKQRFAQWLTDHAESYSSGIVDFFVNSHFDSHDPHSSVMGDFFDVAEILHADGRVVPDSWGFRPGGGGSPTVRDLAERGSELALMYEGEEISARDLRELGDFLSEAQEQLTEMGLAY